MRVIQSPPELQQSSCKLSSTRAIQVLFLISAFKRPLWISEQPWQSRDPSTARREKQLHQQSLWLLLGLAAASDAHLLCGKGCSHLLSWLTFSHVPIFSFCEISCSAMKPSTQVVLQLSPQCDYAFLNPGLSLAVKWNLDSAQTEDTGPSSTP